MNMSENTGIRISRLERSSRLYTVILVVMFCGMMISARTGKDPEVIRASAFEILDARGVVRAAIEMQDGFPVVSLRDSVGAERLVATTNADETAIFVKDSTGTVRLGMAQFAHGGGGFAAHGPDSRGAAVLYLKNRGSLTFYDQQNQIVMRVPEND